MQRPADGVGDIDIARLVDREVVAERSGRIGHGIAGLGRAGLQVEGAHRRLLRRLVRRRPHRARAGVERARGIVGEHAGHEGDARDLGVDPQVGRAGARLGAIDPALAHAAEDHVAGLVGGDALGEDAGVAHRDVLGVGRARRQRRDRSNRPKPHPHARHDPVLPVTTYSCGYICPDLPRPVQSRPSSLARSSRRLNVTAKASKSAR